MNAKDVSPFLMAFSTPKASILRVRVKQAVTIHTLRPAAVFKAVKSGVFLSTVVFRPGLRFCAAIFAIFRGSFGSMQPGVWV